MSSIARGGDAGTAMEDEDSQKCEKATDRRPSREGSPRSASCKRPRSPPPDSSEIGREKGKRKSEEEQAHREINKCGICLSDEGKATRGRVDCCDHYFCFVCIMEWAKLESRCPVCKRRFGSICRLPQKGIFAGERIVQIPVRDQVFKGLENGTIGPSDPYANVCCTCCHDSEDENLLLLCDLCDAAMHSYCIGLGFTVPEGDWYCDDCKLSRDEHSGCEVNTGCGTDIAISEIVNEERSLHQLVESRSTTSREDGNEVHEHSGCEADTDCGTDITISEIVNEERSLDQLAESRSITSREDGNEVHEHSVCEADTGRGTGITISEIVKVERNLDQLAESRSITSREDGNEVHDHRSPRVTQCQSCCPTNKEKPRGGSRTLNQRRNLRGRIHKLRENWSALQNESILFSSNVLDSGCSSEMVFCNSNNSQASVSMGALPAQNSVATSMQNQSSYDVDRAWKMMEMAKHIEVTTGNFGYDPVSKRNAHEEARKKSLPPSIFEKNPSNEKNPSIYKNKGSAAPYKCQKDLIHGSVQTKSKRHGKNQMQQVEMRHLQQAEMRSPASSVRNDSQSSRQTIKSCLATKKPLNLDHEEATLDNYGLTTDSLSRAFEISSSDMEHVSSTSRKAELSGKIIQGCLKFKDSRRKDDDLKSEIQSLVKLNLKLICNGKQLGAERFKTVAKLATHTVLAACGLMHTRSHVRPCPSITCMHIVQSKNCCASNLMPNSCRECFYAFVKYVVDSIMAETALSGPILEKMTIGAFTGLKS